MIRCSPGDRREDASGVVWKNARTGVVRVRADQTTSVHDLTSLRPFSTTLGGAATGRAGPPIRHDTRNSHSNLSLADTQDGRRTFDEVVAVFGNYKLSAGDRNDVIFACRTPS